MEYERWSYLVKTFKSVRDTDVHWAAYPPNNEMAKREKLPAFNASSQEKINEMVDFAVSLSLEERPDTIEGWNKLLEEKGIIPKPMMLVPVHGIQEQG